MQEFQANRDKLPMIRERAAERANSIENVQCACARCVNILLHYEFSFGAMQNHRYKYKCEHDSTLFSSVRVGNVNYQFAYDGDKKFICAHKSSDRSAKCGLHAFRFIIIYCSVYFECKANWKQFASESVSE